MTTKEVLEQALLKIRKGWTKGVLRRVTDDGVTLWCAWGAILEVTEEREWPLVRTIEVTEVADDMLYRALPADWQIGGNTGGAVSAYNDRPDTTQEDMIKLFERAIDLA